MTILWAKNYSSRRELEDTVRNLAGLTPDKKPDFEISGTEKELARLHLSQRTIFWGISCRITGESAAPVRPESETQIKKPQRGEIRPYGLDGKLVKPLTKSK